MIVDLRSDTVTKPTPEMYEAMAKADLGDDVLGDDPTVIALEELAAKKMGKEAALFVPSGTMGNQIAVRMWTTPGEGVILEQDSHIMYYESGSIGAHAGVVTWTLPSQNAVMDPSLIRSRLIDGNIHSPRTSLLCLENSHNRAGGATIPIEMMREYRSIADSHGMKVHLDGARIYNAAHFLGVPAREIASYADSVSFCLSKGLSCPVGSLVTGRHETIERARFIRKRLGGGMRQAGILAACGIYALNNLTERLSDDHSRARDFAEHLSASPGFLVDMDSVQTNIIMVGTVGDAPTMRKQLAEKGLWCNAYGARKIRFVFHREIDDEKLEFAKNVVREVQPALS